MTSCLEKINFYYLQGETGIVMKWMGEISIVNILVPI